jgi:hypothetical protein
MARGMDGVTGKGVPCCKWVSNKQGDIQMNIMKVIPLAMLATCGHPAYANECASSEIVYDLLHDQFAEDPIFFGNLADGSFVEIWVGEETWTAIVTNPMAGVSCTLTDGVGYSRPNLEGEL